MQNYFVGFPSLRKDVCFYLRYFLVSVAWCLESKPVQIILETRSRNLFQDGVLGMCMEIWPSTIRHESKSSQNVVFKVRFTSDPLLIAKTVASDLVSKTNTQGQICLLFIVVVRKLNFRSLGKILGYKNQTWAWAEMEKVYTGLRLVTSWKKRFL